jgi:prepilin peptidase CpaA
MSDSAAALFDLMFMLVTNPQIILLFVLLVFAAVIDCRTFRIPNWLTLGGALAGLLSSTVSTGRPLDGFLWALTGMAAGFVVMLPFYALRFTGAGDVKLMAAIGALLGFPGILYAVLFTFITGGIAAVAFAVFNRVTGRMANNVGAIAWSITVAAFTGTSPAASIRQAGSVGKLPYAVSIGIGTTVYVVANQLGFA